VYTAKGIIIVGNLLIIVAVILPPFQIVAGSLVWLIWYALKVHDWTSDSTLVWISLKSYISYQEALTLTYCWHYFPIIDYMDIMDAPSC